MSNENEIRSLIETGNKQIAALREATETKADADKVARIEADLAKTLEAKSALEARLEAIETASARANVLAGKSDEAADEYKSAFIAAIRKPTDFAARQAAEALAVKSVNIGTGSAGGFAVPAQIAAEIAKIATDYSPIRNIARVVQVSTSDYTELLDNANAGYEWVGETTTRAVTTTPTLGQVAPVWGEISAVAEVTLSALEDMAFDAEAWLAESLGEKFAQAEGNAFVLGDGVNKPAGFLTAGFQRTMSGVAATMGTNPDRLIDLYYATKAAYRTNGVWVMNSGTMAGLAKMKDTTGNYFLTRPLAAGVASTILGHDVVIAEDMPDVAAGATPVAFGNFRKGYLIADRVGYSVLTDPYSKTGFLTVKGRKRVGGVAKDLGAIRLLEIGT